MKICFIGGGNMAEAMIAGMTTHGYNAQNIVVFDRNTSKCNNLVNKYSVKVSNSIIEMVKEANILILAIKPQGMVELINEIKKYITDSQIIVTVAAGIETKSYENLFGKQIPFARTIPNTPSSLGYGATGIFFNKNVNNKDKDIIIEIMKTMGKVTVVSNEKEIDIIAAIASSGPAYYFQFMEHMVNAAVNHGLDADQAEKLVIQTCLGAAQMALNTNEDISTLRKNVTSKNGITYEALKVFDDSNLGDIINKAINANLKRAKELAKEFENNINM